jgi:hypothetical protein
MATTLDGRQTNERFLCFSRRGPSIAARGTPALSTRSPGFVGAKHLRTKKLLHLR